MFLRWPRMDKPNTGLLLFQWPAQESMSRWYKHDKRPSHNKFISMWRQRVRPYFLPGHTASQTSESTGLGKWWLYLDSVVPVPADSVSDWTTDILKHTWRWSGWNHSSSHQQVNLSLLKQTTVFFLFLRKWRRNHLVCNVFLHRLKLIN